MMEKSKLLKKNKDFYVGIMGTILEGVLSGTLFSFLYRLMNSLWNNQFDYQYALVLTGTLAGIFLLRVLLYGYSYTKAQIGGAEVSRRIRLFMGDKIKKIPLARFTKSQTGEYIQTITTDVNNYEKIITHKVGDLAKNCSLSILIITFVAYLSLSAGVILLIGTLMLVPAMYVSFRIVKKYGEEKNEISAENVSSIVEYVAGMQTFRAYGIGGVQNKMVTQAMKAFCDISFIYEAKIIPIGTVFGILNWLCCPLIMWTSYSVWRGGGLSTMSYLLICMLPLFNSKLANAIFIDLTSYKNLTISKNKIVAIMDEPEELGEVKEFSPNTHDIQFESVYFSYNKGEPILKDISFSAPNQKLTAIVGDSGSGKSTILHLISKYYQMDQGQIRIGNISIASIQVESVLSQISMVDQDIFLFNDTIRENIRHARPKATDKEIEKACELANCVDFILKLPDGYDTEIGENGNLLSGGERQRLSIARAILKDSPILLLDEATASLDIENELAVKQAITRLLQANKTVLMIAHTLSIIQQADQILVVGEGKIIEAGTHQELLEKKGKYFHMWEAEQKSLK